MRNKRGIRVTRYIKWGKPALGNEDYYDDSCVYISYRQKMVKCICNSHGGAYYFYYFLNNQSPLKASWRLVKNYKMEKLMLMLGGNVTVDNVYCEQLIAKDALKKLLKIKR